jgi:hypothetical protein
MVGALGTNVTGGLVGPRAIMEHVGRSKILALMGIEL